MEVRWILNVCRYHGSYFELLLPSAKNKGIAFILSFLPTKISSLLDKQLINPLSGKNNLTL
jgi:hypothetical protein